VLKAVGDAIPHKTELGLVALGIEGGEKLAYAWGALNRRVDAADVRSSVKGFLVQEFVAVGVEVFAGIVRDPDFGLFLAFGTGGIGIEMLRDFTLRTLPLRDGDAEAMIGATGAAALLAAGRGARRRMSDGSRNACMLWPGSPRPAVGASPRSTSSRSRSCRKGGAASSSMR
jgi:acetate---CoA ligase (ADP-forming)